MKANQATTINKDGPACQERRTAKYQSNVVNSLMHDDPFGWFGLGCHLVDSKSATKFVVTLLSMASLGPNLDHFQLV